MSNHVYSDLEVVPGKTPPLVPVNDPNIMPSSSYEADKHYVQGVQGVPDVPEAASNRLRTTNSTSSPPSSNSSSTSPTPTSSTLTDTNPTVSTTTVIFPSATLARDCPSSNQTTYSIAYGEDEPITFRKFCSAGFRHVLNFNHVVEEQTLSLNDCINACVSYDDKNKEAIAAGDSQICNAVCWRNNEQQGGPDHIPGSCFGYAALNSSTGVIVVEKEYCDSALWINQRDL
ncbi:hypothetical protein NPX13_g5906 [Xylaria arbuscula]|uniref:Uncharacterized protein n=1 Tax=Xylaria arbuscula TaxID=114810 RepID=A0A9W8ND64_9PEZI|nr:hypothetical protein NPX13_g5906 [Xylaria arbuscula]